MENSPLNTLSAEIRNQIYELAFKFEEPLGLYDGSAAQPPLTRVCKQIRSESLLLFYNLNTFSVPIQNPIFASRLDIEPGKGMFREPIQHTMMWMKATPKPCHKAVKSLVLSLNTAYVSRVLEPIIKGQHQGTRELYARLRHQGYGDDRMEIYMQKLGMYAPTARAYDAADAFFRYVGFKRVTRQG